MDRIKNMGWGQWILIGVAGSIFLAIIGSTEAGKGLLGLAFIIGLILLYFLPAIIAGRRRNPDEKQIMILNVFLGWTFVGWVIALIWAYKEPPKKKKKNSPAWKQREFFDNNLSALLLSGYHEIYWRGKPEAQATMTNIKTNMAIGYGRVSSLNQEITGYSLPAQEKIIRDYAEKHSLEIGKRIILVAESASGKVDRKKFHEMLDLVKKEGICNMIVESVDRLARNFREANKIDEWLMSDGRNRIHFIRGSTVMHKDSEYQEWFFYRMNLAAAEMGTKQISANVRKGQKEKIAQGGFPSKPPLGYRTTGERGHKTHEIDPEKAPFIKQMFELYSSGQHSLKSLTKLLEQEGLRNRSGRPIVKSRVAELLSDPFYYGDMRWGGEIYLAGHKPLISKELYDRVQKIMHSKTTPKYRKHDFLFKQLMKCEICGGTITGEIQKNHIYYHCNGYRGCKRRISARGDVLEAQIIEVFDWFENGLDPEEGGIVQEILKEDHKDKIQYMQNQISEIHSRLNTLTQREKRDYENKP